MVCKAIVIFWSPLQLKSRLSGHCLPLTAIVGHCPSRPLSPPSPPLSMAIDILTLLCSSDPRCQPLWWCESSCWCVWAFRLPLHALSTPGVNCRGCDRYDLFGWEVKNFWPNHNHHHYFDEELLFHSNGTHFHVYYNEIKGIDGTNETNEANETEAHLFIHVKPYNISPDEHHCNTSSSYRCSSE